MYGLLCCEDEGIGVRACGRRAGGVDELVGDGSGGRHGMEREAAPNARP